MVSVDDIASQVQSSVSTEDWPEIERGLRSAPHPIMPMLMNAMLVGVSLNAVRGLGEELGWRGFLHHELGIGFFRKVTLTGVIWGVWYAPLVLQGFTHSDAPIAGVPMYIAWSVMMSAILTYLRERSGSVLACAILYGTMQSVAAMEQHLPLVHGGSTLIVGVHGVAGIAALAIVFGVMLWHDRRIAEAPIIR
jgi:membrane protease YdiL (CAAX protease family)